MSNDQDVRRGRRSAASSSSSAAWRPATPTFGVLCADHHPGYSQPIGGGIAYEGYVSPSGVGYDIGCGNKAVRTELTRADLDALGGVERVMREITRRISFGMGVPAQRADRPPGARPDPQRGVRAAAAARAARGVAARHGRLGQPLRERDGGRGRAACGSACTSARAASATRPRPASSRSRRVSRSTRGRTRARWTRRRCCSRSARSSASRTSRRWSWRASTPTPAATSSSRRCSRSSAPRRRTRCTTTTTSRGWRSTSAAPTGSSARAARRRGRARRASSAARWATSR